KNGIAGNARRDGFEGLGRLREIERCLTRDAARENAPGGDDSRRVAKSAHQCDLARHVPIGKRSAGFVEASRVAPLITAEQGAASQDPVVEAPQHPADLCGLRCADTIERSHYWPIAAKAAAVAVNEGSIGAK